MTKEQDKAIERCNKLIETEHSNWIGITNQKAIETVLNMLKEKDEEIEMYKDIKEIANYKVTDLAKLKKTDEIQEELDKKNKIIDLYIDELVAEEFDNPCTECCQECEKDKDTLESCIKQYFERKAEES